MILLCWMSTLHNGKEAHDSVYYANDAIHFKFRDQMHLMNFSSWTVEYDAAQAKMNSAHGLPCLVETFCLM